MTYLLNTTLYNCPATHSATPDAIQMGPKILSVTEVSSFDAIVTPKIKTPITNSAKPSDILQIDASACVFTLVDVRLRYWGILEVPVLHVY